MACRDVEGAKRWCLRQETLWVLPIGCDAFIERHGLDGADDGMSTCGACGAASGRKYGDSF